MDAARTEKVMVVRAGVLRRLNIRAGFTLAGDELLNLLLNENTHHFLSRATAERSGRWRQIIPYVILCSGNRIWTYLRGDGEQRLKDKRSIGFGGHIRLEDRSVPVGNRSWYERSIYRELSEELYFRPPRHLQMLGVVNDRRTNVGRVHLGIVYVCYVSGAGTVHSRDPQVRALSLMSVEELSALQNELEPWSRSLIKQIHALKVTRSSRKDRQVDPIQILIGVRSAR